MKLHLHLFLAVAMAAAFPVAAEKADRDKPMNAEADALRYDDLTQTSIFTGNVVITKGTMLIRGGRVEVTQDPEGFQHAVVNAAPGKLAYYKSKRDNVDEYIEGEGEVIEYDGRADTVKFIRNAVLRRYAGSTLVDETNGALIRYENLTDVFTVESGAQPNRTAVNPGGRVRALLSPRAPAAGAATPPPPASSSPSPGLRSSPALNNQ